MAHPVIGQKSTRRKQWTLLSSVEICERTNYVPYLYEILFLDRTQNRYNCFGSYLAEDGWPDSQVDLAKQLLNENCGKIVTCFEINVSSFLNLQPCYNY